VVAVADGLFIGRDHRGQSLWPSAQRAESADQAEVYSDQLPMCEISSDVSHTPGHHHRRQPWRPATFNASIAHNTPKIASVRRRVLDTSNAHPTQA
jgi:hypothetical protein